MPMQKSNLHGLTVFYEDQQEFHSLKNEIFTQHGYYFETENARPFIIDAGAHIGLATLYFKKQFPGARIVAIEPHPANVKVLEQNLFENRFDDVTVIEAALSTHHESELTLHMDRNQEWLSTTSIHPGAWTGDQLTTEIVVPTLDLAELLTGPVDLLKMDIEGAEQAVIESVRDQLYLVTHFFIEFHPTPEQSFEKFTKLLEEEDFALSYHKKGKPVRRDEAQYGLVMIEGQRG